MTFHIQPGAIPDSAWTERASDTCGLCGGSTERDDHEDLEDLHPVDCPGCPLCEIPIRLFRTFRNGRVLGAVFHFNCFEKILVKKPEREPQ